MSISDTGNPKAITVKAYGPPSARLQELGVNDKLFFRGPYGVPFTEVKERKLIIGSGSGMACLMPLVDSKSTVMISAKKASELLYRGKINAENVIYITDDGSEGTRGFPDTVLRDFDTKEFHMVYVCGPEAMMYKVLGILSARQNRAEFSLERSMKCGIGICDSCSIDGIQLCRDGPVIGIERLKNSIEFGRSKLDHSGKRIRVEI